MDLFVSTLVKKKKKSRSLRERTGSIFSLVIFISLLFLIVMIVLSIFMNYFSVKFHLIFSIILISLLRLFALFVFLKIIFEITKKGY
ncbi:MAG: hypothetical protein WCY43_03135 [Patescibacteria group bacterium]|jgi:hypothetical protein